MKVLKHSVAIGAIALVGLLNAPAVDAQDFNPNKKTYFTFSAPVEVPGATLQAGKYLFQLADLQGNRHVVQIFNEDGSTLIVTTLTIPEQRLEPTGDPVVKFIETPAGTAAAIRSWFYPGDTIGDEFIYPKEQAMRIARATSQTVLSSDTISGEGIQGMKAETVARIDAEGAAAAAAAAAEVTLPPVTSPETPVEIPAPVGTTGRTELPRTASDTPLVGLIGLLALAGALSIRTLARNRA